MEINRLIEKLHELKEKNIKELPIEFEGDTPCLKCGAISSKLGADPYNPAILTMVTDENHKTSTVTIVEQQNFADGKFAIYAYPNLDDDVPRYSADINNFKPDKSLRCSFDLVKDLFDKIERIKWYLYQISYIMQGCDNFLDYNGIYRNYNIDEDIAMAVGMDSVETIINKIYNLVKHELEVKIEEIKSLKKSSIWDDSDIDYVDWEDFGPHRKFYNEVDLPPVCEKLLNLLVGQIHEQHENDVYLINCYDFSGYEISFADEKKAEDFMYYIDCGTLYKKVDGQYVEEYSF